MSMTLKVIFTVITAVALILGSTSSALADTRADDTRELSPAAATAVEEELRAHPAALPWGPIVTAVVAAIGGGYKVAEAEGKAMAVSGKLWWSQWNGAVGLAIKAGAGSLGLLGMAGLAGFSHGFTTECMKHTYCKNR